ncbi:hypothetical protein, partial [Pseudomonas marginalis]|uniref:hypothetical protein n=1 Tax=Pseudomonas marginalis TaxID=298 RepID=UPI0005FC13D7
AFFQAELIVRFWGGCAAQRRASLLTTGAPCHWGNRNNLACARQEQMHIRGGLFVVSRLALRWGA